MRCAGSDPGVGYHEIRRWGDFGKQVSFTCRECDAIVEPDYGDKRRVYCSDECHGRWQRRQGKRRGLSYHRRRAAERIKRLRPRLLARYDGRCGICGRAIDLTLPSPHPGSLTIDHIHPLSAGGSDDEANLWPAHRLCNEEKGDEVGWRPGGLHGGGGRILSNLEARRTPTHLARGVYGSPRPESPR